MHRRAVDNNGPVLKHRPHDQEDKYEKKRRKDKKRRLCWTIGGLLVGLAVAAFFWVRSHRSPGVPAHTIVCAGAHYDLFDAAVSSTPQDAQWLASSILDDDTCNIKALDVTTLTRAQLVSKISKATEPLMLRCAIDESWPAARSWRSRGNFLRMFGEHEVRVDRGATLAKYWPPDDLNRSSTDFMKISEYSRAVRNRYVKDDAYVNHNVSGTAIAHDAEPLEALFKEVSLLHKETRSGMKWHAPLSTSRLAMGGANSGMAFHDGMMDMTALIVGQKRWHVANHHLAQDLIQHSMKPKPNNHEWVPGGNGLAHDVPDAERPRMSMNEFLEWIKHLDSMHPIKKNMQRFSWHCTQNAGDIMVIPPGMWRGTVNLGEAVAISVHGDERIRSRLHEAASQGDLAEAEQLLNDGHPIDHPDGSGIRHPLHDAAKHGHREVVSMLLDRGANVDGAKDGGLTPLHMSVLNGHTDVADTLIEKGGASVHEPLNRTFVKGFTPLHFAAIAYQNDTSMLRLLLDKGAAPNARDGADRTASHILQERAGNITGLDIEDALTLLGEH